MFTLSLANERSNSKKTKLLEARENENDPLAIVFSFTIDWLRGSRKSSRPVKIKLSKTKVIPDYF